MTECESVYYEKFITKKIIKTKAKVAEFSKLVENAYRDVNIAFANEIASSDLTGKTPTTSTSSEPRFPKSQKLSLKIAFTYLFINSHSMQEKGH